MKKEKSLKSGNKFGPRYGRKNRERWAVIENEQRRSHKCPFCNYVKVKRVSLGIWSCQNCRAKFASRAYTIGKLKLKEQSQAMQEEQKQEALVQ